ncbi:MarR family winged helix-turn-helix transcriptional regulator [Streptomyces sp. NPDC006259]|uniref:MarR family winged helix-turn-helix transcriptional regulator n=1 Tax=Streptomyces sp. NPDC006259 TaxID=3364740 RepID=UPI0036AADD63
MNEKPHWLAPKEQHAWRSFVGVHQKLLSRIERELQATANLSSADYAVLVALTGTPDGRLRFQALLRAVEWSQSRASHHIARMAKRGLVTREDCPDDGRGVYVVVTPAGRQAIEAAAPHHVATVRSVVIDPLTTEELDTLAHLCQRMLHQMEQRSP